MVAASADAQQPAAATPAPPIIDWAKIQIKTTDLGNKTYMLEGQGGNITVAVGSDGIIMVDGQFAPLSDKIKAAIKAISPLPVKYLVNTHFHGDHTGGNENFAKDGAIIVAHDNIRVRLAAGTPQGLTGAKAPPRPAEALPKQTYFGGSIALEVGGRKAQLTHISNAHTDGDTWVYFADANVLADRRHVQQPQALPEHRLRQWRRRARHDPRDRHLSQGGQRQHEDRARPRPARDQGRPGHLPRHAGDLARPHREAVQRGQDRAGGGGAGPLADLDATWGNNQQHAIGHTRNVYNSFKRF